MDAVLRGRLVLEAADEDFTDGRKVSDKVPKGKLVLETAEDVKFADVEVDVVT
jgi:hypothetical protein